MSETGQIDYQELAAAMLGKLAANGGSGERHKAVSSTPTTIYGHGSGGLFSHPALERPVFSAMLLPNVGLASVLPVRPTNLTDPLYGILTGVTATTGSEPTNVCDDPPVAGLTKLCMQTAALGRFSRMTRVFDVDRIGRLTDRGEHTDFELVNNPFGGSAGTNPDVPTLPGAANARNVLNNEVAKATFELGVAWSRDFADVLYTGNPTNNTAGGGYKEYRGLDLLINTGYRDAETGVACPAADSIVLSFSNVDVANNSAGLVRTLTYMYRNAKYNAARANLMPVKWVFTMRWGLFYEIAQVWPIAYSTYRVTGVIPTGSTNFVDAGEISRQRDLMLGDMSTRTGQYLLIDGERVPVILDDGIDEVEGLANGAFRSSIYLVPLTVLGRIQVTYMEYYNYDGPGATMEAAKYFAPENSYWTTDNGRFIWHKKPPTNWCVQMLAKTEPRLILRTPYIAARLTNVQYTPLQHEREPFTDSGYFFDGGRTDRIGYGPSYYSPTA